MFDYEALSRELRYGCPAADQILVNRNYTVGYSYYFRQARWALEIVDPDKEDMTEVERMNNFRPDYRIPKRFRANLSDYKRSGFTRGHLVASKNQNDTRIQNSETFLLPNMCPQRHGLNSGKWLELEKAIRRLDSREDVLETYVITGPIFDFYKFEGMIGENDDNGVDIPIPSHFFKCILAETETGKLKMWAFEMPNSKIDNDIADYRCSTAKIEQRAGLLLWHVLTDERIEEEKNRIREMWEI